MGNGILSHSEVFLQLNKSCITALHFLVNLAFERFTMRLYTVRIPSGVYPFLVMWANLIYRLQRENCTESRTHIWRCYSLVCLEDAIVSSPCNFEQRIRRIRLVQLPLQRNRLLPPAPFRSEDLFRHMSSLQTGCLIRLLQLAACLTLRTSSAYDCCA